MRRANMPGKLIKRIGYGRAKPDLLRQRVLHRCVA